MKKNTQNTEILAVTTTGNVTAVQPKKKSAKKIKLDLPEVVETPTPAAPVVVSRKEVVASNMTGKGLARKIAADKKKTTPKKAAAPKAEVVKVTMLEHAVLMGLIGSLYAEPGFSDVECADLAKTCKLSVKSIKGVIGSLTKKGLVFTDALVTNGLPAIDLVYLAKKAYCLHTEWSADATEWIELEIEDAKGNTTVNVAKANILVVNTTSRKPQSTKPYGKFGLHGHNIDVKGLKKGDSVSFEIKKQTVVGEFIHVHVNNHSPKGYAVIKYNGKIYERVMDKVNKVIAPKALPASKTVDTNEMMKGLQAAAAEGEANATKKTVAKK